MQFARAAFPYPSGFGHPVRRQHKALFWLWSVLVFGSNASAWSLLVDECSPSGTLSSIAVACGACMIGALAGIVYYLRLKKRLPAGTAERAPSPLLSRLRLYGIVPLALFAGSIFQISPHASIDGGPGSWMSGFAFVMAGKLIAPKSRWSTGLILLLLYGATAWLFFGCACVTIEDRGYAAIGALIATLIPIPDHLWAAIKRRPLLALLAFAAFVIAVATVNGGRESPRIAKALAGDRGEQFRLAMRYSEFDREEAFWWLLMAAKNGHTIAQMELAERYEYGDGTPVNRAMAAKWWRALAEQGDPAGQFYLGRLYLTGVGVRRDPIEGVACLIVAKDGGADTIQPRSGETVVLGHFLASAMNSMSPAQAELAMSRAKAIQERFGAMW